jgi:Holliday junction resolvase
MTSEQDIQKKIIKYLEMQDAFCFKVIAANKNGIPDIIACVDSVFYGIEVKKPGGRVSKIQEIQLSRIEAAGGVKLVAYSVDDVRKLFNKV